MGVDDEAVRNGDDDGESGADLELFRQLVAIPPKKCLRPACRVGVTVRCRHVKLTEQNSKAEKRQPS